MPLSEAALQEIRTELADLHQLRVIVDERTRALEAILKPFDFAQFGLPFASSALSAAVSVVSSAPTLSGAGHVSASTSATLSDAPNPYAGTGLRSAALSVLSELGSARAPEVAKILEERGFPTGGKTRFSTRVYNDLFRLTKTGKLEVNNGVFRVK
jgi:hypothetical protein